MDNPKPEASPDEKFVPITNSNLENPICIKDKLIDERSELDDETGNFYTEVNLKYRYEDTDISGILVVKIKDLNNTAQFIPRYPVGNSAITLRQCLLDDKKIHQRARQLFIPFNISAYDWLGLVVTFNNLNMITKIQYIDSLIDKRRSDRIQAEVFSCKDICVELAILNIETVNGLIQDNEADCGPLIIENLISIARGGRLIAKKVTPLEIRIMRKEHVKIFKPYCPNFDTRQKHNFNKVTSIIARHKCLKNSHSSFNLDEIERINQCVLNIMQIGAQTIRNNLFDAFHAQDRLDEEYIYHARIRTILIKQRKILREEDKIAFINLIAALFNADAQMAMDAPDFNNCNFRLSFHALKAIISPKNIDIRQLEELQTDIKRISVTRSIGDVHLFMQKVLRVIQEKPKDILAEIKKYFSEIVIDKKQFDDFFASTTRDFLFKREVDELFDLLPIVTIRIWRKNNLLESPMATHVSLDTGNIYASLWPPPDNLMKSFNNDLIKIHQDASGSYGRTIKLRSLTTVDIDRSFEKITDGNIPWDAYGSWNCSYFSYLCKVCGDVLDPREGFHNLLKSALSIVSRTNIDEDSEPEEFYKKRHEILNCSGLVLSLMEHGGINKIIELPLLSAKKNKVISALKILTIINGLIWFLYNVVAKSIEGDNIKDGLQAVDPLVRGINYSFLSLLTVTLFVHTPYWIANAIYAYRGIGFWVTPKGVEWVAGKLEDTEKELKLLLQEVEKEKTTDVTISILDKKLDKDSFSNSNSLSTPFLPAYNLDRKNDEENLQPTKLPPKSRKCCVIL